MTSPIYFNNPKAREQLVNMGIVFTVRRVHDNVDMQGVNYVTTARWGSYYKFQVIGDVEVSHVVRFTQATQWTGLKPYLSLSGFDTLDEWKAVIQKTYRQELGEGKPLDLFRVELVRQSTTSQPTHGASLGGVR